MATLPFAPTSGSSLPTGVLSLGRLAVNIATAPFRFVGGLVVPPTGAQTRALLPLAKQIGVLSSPQGRLPTLSSAVSRPSVVGTALQTASRVAQGSVNLLGRIASTPQQIIGGIVQTGVSAVQRIKDTMVKNEQQKVLASTLSPIRDAVIRSGQLAVERLNEALFTRIERLAAGGEPQFPTTGLVGVSTQEPLRVAGLERKPDTIILDRRLDPVPIISERVEEAFPFFFRRTPEPVGVPLPGDSATIRRETVERIERTTQGIPLWVWVLIALAIILGMRRRA